MGRKDQSSRAPRDGGARLSLKACAHVICPIRPCTDRLRGRTSTFGRSCPLAHQFCNSNQGGGPPTLEAHHADSHRGIPLAALHPCHPNDLLSPFRGSAKREEFAAGIKAWLLGVALLTGQSLDEDDAVDFYGRMKAGQSSDRQSAHLVHATRSPDWQRTGVIGREFCGHPIVSHSPYALGHGSNGLVMRLTEHGDFDSKRWAILPFPNAGLLSPDQARSSNEVWQGLPIQRKRRKTAILQPACDHRIHVLESLSEGSCPAQVPVPARVPCATSNPAAMDFTLSKAPPAAILAYSYVARHLGRPNGRPGWSHE